MKAAEQLGPYTLALSPDSFPLGRDSLLLGAFATVRPHWRVCDMGCGAGTLLLLLAAREPSLSLTGVEWAEGEAALCRENLRQNSLSGQVFTGDLRDTALLPAGGFDLVISNPPYFSACSGGDGGPARMEHLCTLQQLCRAAARALRSGGRFALVHRPERLTDLLTNLRGSGLEPKRLRLCSHRAQLPPFAVLTEAVRQGRPGLEVLPPLIEVT